MKRINNARLCCVQLGRLDYELSARTRGITMGGGWMGVRCTSPPPCFSTRRRGQKRLWSIKMSEKMPCGVTNAHMQRQQQHTLCEGPRDTLSRTPSEVSHRRVPACGGRRGAVKAREDSSRRKPLERRARGAACTRLKVIDPLTR